MTGENDGDAIIGEVIDGDACDTDVADSDITDELLASYQTFQRRVLDRIEALLADQYDASTIRNLVHNRLFRANEVLPKRDSRPKTTTAFVAEQIYRVHDGDVDKRDNLLEFAVIVAEYADVLDDVVDGDVADGHQTEALLVSQLLVPVMIRSLDRLGDRALDYWTDDVMTLVQAPLVRERESTPSPETYRKLLDEQASLRSSITGLAAVTAGADRAEVKRAERVGRAVHRLMQFSTDLYQHGRDDDPWNAVALFSEDDFVDAAETFRAELAAAVATYPSPYADRITVFWDRDFRTDYRNAVRDVY